MNSAQPRTRSMTVIALVTSLGIVPSCAPSLQAACAIAQTHHAIARCCCGDHCRCVNCTSHQQPSNDRQNAPATPTAARDLINVAAAVAHFDLSTADNGPSLIAWSPVVEGPPLQTLVAQHACLRV